MKAYDPSLLNDEQRPMVEHPEGNPAACLAGAGSGKTHALTNRVIYLTDVLKVVPRKILCVTFTNKAANELKERIHAGEDPHNSPRVTTIHSLALSAIRKNPTGFGLNEKVSPIDDYNQSQIVKKIAEDFKLEEFNAYNFLEKVSYHRVRGVGFRVDYTADIHAQAQKDYSGLRAMTPDDLAVWKRFEEEKLKMSVVDFDDMLHLVVRRGEQDEKWRNSIQKMFHHILMDEAQDTNVIQWKFINLLVGPDNKNLMVVGDLSQCQPPGTKVKIVVEPGHGPIKAKVAYKNIEELTSEDKVVSWSKSDQISYNSGRSIEVGARPYKGVLYTIRVKDKETKCTPTHWNWVRFNKGVEDKYAVYLMHREDLGFRVGTTAFKRKTSEGVKGCYGFIYRLNQEKAEKGWLLRLCDTKTEAEAWEEVYSVKYGIPESMFESGPCRSKTQELIQLVFSHANPQGGFRCLEEHGLLFEAPIAHRGQGASWRGWFKTVAANILPVVMDIPLEGSNKFSEISAKLSENYEGMVYSLEVEKDHTYVADGLIVGNSIYGFSGASPNLLYNYTKSWRGLEPTLYKLERNHRSVPEIVKLANKTQRQMAGVIPIQMDSHRGTKGEKGSIVLRKGVTPRDIAASISDDIRVKNQLVEGRVAYKDTAILIRAGSMVRDIEPELVRNRIPYIIRGAMGLMQTEEVRDILSYMRIMSNPRDYFAMLRSISVPKRGVGDATLEKIRTLANKDHDGDLIAGAKAYDHIKFTMYLHLIDRLIEEKDNPLKVLEMIIAGTKYKNLISEKYKKDKDKIEQKFANLKRLEEVIQGLLAANQLTTDDLVFQLTMQDQKDDASKDGKVVISTIHAAKGLEWNTVYVAGCVESQLPHKWSQSEAEIHEERRVFYVAATRAKDNLILCVPAMLEYFNKGNQFVTPSRFLTELGICK
jgi:DNA helicase-2/ATP-dependent DNA helicase PcrA